MRLKREKMHLWLAIIIAISMAAYRLSVDLVDHAQWLPATFMHMPLTEVLMNTLFFWVLALLWLAYRQWKASIHREKSLAEVISSVRPVAMLVVTPDRRITLSNAAAGALFCCDAATMIGKSTEEFYDDRRTAGEAHPVAQALDETGFHVGDAVGRRQNGDNFPLEIATALLRAGNGAVLLLRDLTESKLADAALREAKHRAELINRITPSAVFTVDMANNVTSWNQRAEEILGFTAEEVIGKSCTTFADSPCRDKCGLCAADVAKPILHRECTVLTKQGHRRVILKNVDYIRDRAGTIVGGIESFEDITERKEAEREMQNMNEIMMGREERILELKREVNELRVRAGLPPEYDLA